MSDVRYGLRMMRRSPGFLALALASLALGIGANTAIFSLINTLLWRTLPVREPGQLVEFLSKYPGDPFVNAFSWQSYQHFRDQNQVFSGLAGAHPSRLHVRGEGLEPETVEGARVIGNFFQVLGMQPAIGRLIAPEDTAVAVLSWSYWKNRFDLDPAILGKRMVVDDAPVTVIGVTAREFFGLEVGARPDIWMPLDRDRVGLGGLRLIARLKPGVSLAQVRAEMAVLFRWTFEERTRTSQDPLNQRLKFAVQPAATGLSTGLRDRFAKPLLVLMAVVGLLLLAACTNVATMLLARGAARQREMAVRVWLGACRLRLVRLLLTESLLLSTAGSLLGLVFAYFGADALVRIMVSGRPIVGMPPHLDIQVRPDTHLVLFTAGAALLTAVLFGLVPAWRAFAGQMQSRRIFGKSLVVAQVALSVGMLSAAGLFIRHLSNLERTDLGFRRDHVLLLTLDPSGSGLSGERLSRAYQELLERLQAIPGIQSAALSAATPISGAGASRFATVEGHPERRADRRYLALNWVAPKYFETLGTPLLAGRDFNFEDQGRPRVAIVNQAMARYYFSAGNPIGKHLSFDGDRQAYEIVGVVGDAKYYEIREATPRTVYLDAFQFPGAGSQFELCTAMAPTAIVGEVRRTVREVLKTVPVARFTTLAEQVDASIVPERLIAALSGVFGGLGALLAAIGLYGLLAYTVARRVHEIGIRMALGAAPRDVTRMVQRDALGMVCAGLAIGIPLALWCKSFAASLIEGLPPNSALPIAFGAAAMVVVALVAAYLPARRAARVDPMDALRHE